MPPLEIETNFMLLRRELKKTKNIEALQIVDKIETIVTGHIIHSCPICGEILYELDDGRLECRGMFHGSPITLIHGVRGCAQCYGGGPICNWPGYCLAQRFVEFGKPITCMVGRIDDQSPR